MMKVILFLIVLFNVSQGFGHAEFLERYCDISDDFSYISRFYDYKTAANKKCLLCKNVFLSESDAEVFKNKTFDFTNLENVIFEGGNVGVVNSDFFKHFPNTKRFIFNGTTMDLRPSDTLIANPKVEILSIKGSKISRNYKTNAFHSLPELREMRIYGCFLENTTIDRELLRMNKQLMELHIDDDIREGAHIQHIDDDALDGLDKLEYLFLTVDSMTQMSSRLYFNKPLTAVHIIAKLEEFPKDLPVTIEHLVISPVEHLKRDDFKSLKNLALLEFEGQLEIVDGDAFDDLVNLKLLVLDSLSSYKKLPRALVEKLRMRNVLISKDL